MKRTLVFAIVPIWLAFSQTKPNLPGSPLAEITPAEHELFRLGLDDFTEIETSYMYLPAAPRQQANLQLLVRSHSVDFAQIAGAIQRAARGIDPALVVRVNPLEDNLELWRTLSRLVSGLAGGLGILALLLASIGV